MNNNLRKRFLPTYACSYFSEDIFNKHALHMCPIIVKLVHCWPYSIKGVVLHELKPKFYMNAAQ